MQTGKLRILIALLAVPVVLSCAVADPSGLKHPAHQGRETKFDRACAAPPRQAGSVGNLGNRRLAAQSTGVPVSARRRPVARRGKRFGGR